MTLPELRTIYSNMRAINPLLDELHRRFELGTPTSGTKNLGNENKDSKKEQQGAPKA